MSNRRLVYYDLQAESGGLLFKSTLLRESGLLIILQTRSNSGLVAKTIKCHADG